MKFKQLLLVLLLVALTFAVFSACGTQLDTTIYFYVDDTVYATVQTAGYTSITMPPNPSKEGFVFEGWYWDKDIWENVLTVTSFLNSPITESFSVYAYFTPIEQSNQPATVTITFVVDGSTYATVESDGKSAVSLPNAPSKSGSLFEGWFFDENVWSIPFTQTTLVNSPQSQSFAVYAYFKAFDTTPRTRIAIAFFVDSTAYAVVTTDGQSVVEMPTNPKKSGYNFVGWFTSDGTKFVADTLQKTPSTENISVYAKFEAIPAPPVPPTPPVEVVNISVNFVVDGKTVSTVKSDGKSVVQLPTAPRKGGYNFTGWFTQGGQQFVADTLTKSPTTSNLTVYARFNAIADLFVIPDAVAGGNVFNTITQALESAVDGSIIFVSAGVYAETLVITKPVTLLGNNFDCQDGQRREETVITIGTDIGNGIFAYLGNNSQNVVTICSTDVAIKGMTIDGDSPYVANIWSSERHNQLFGTGAIAVGTTKYLSSQYLTEFLGQDVGIDASVGIFVDSQQEKTVVIENNIMKNFWQFAITANGLSSQSSISCNQISNVLPMGTQYKNAYWGAYGIAISLGENVNGSISNNTVRDCQVAIQVQPNNSTVVLALQNNTIQNCNTGIWLNYMRGQFDIAVTNNHITFDQGKPYFHPAIHYGIGVTTLIKSSVPVVGKVMLEGNVIENYDYAIGVGSVDKEANLVLKENQFNSISMSCVGTFATMFGYSMDKPVYMTLIDNIYSDNIAFDFQNTATFATGDGIEQADAEKFKAENVDTLSLTVESVTVAHKDAVQNALSQLESLSDAVKQLLTAEQALLQKLLEKIEADQQNGVVFVVDTVQLLEAIADSSTTQILIKEGTYELTQTMYLDRSIALLAQGEVVFKSTVASMVVLSWQMEQAEVFISGITFQVENYVGSAPATGIIHVQSKGSIVMQSQPVKLVIGNCQFVNNIYEQGATTRLEGVTTGHKQKVTVEITNSKFFNLRYATYFNVVDTVLFSGNYVENMLIGGVIGEFVSNNSGYACAPVQKFEVTNNTFKNVCYGECTLADWEFYYSAISLGAYRAENFEMCISGNSISTAFGAYGILDTVGGSDNFEWAFMLSQSNGNCAVKSANVCLGVCTQQKFDYALANALAGKVDVIELVEGSYSINKTYQFSNKLTLIAQPSYIANFAQLTEQQLEKINIVSSRGE